MGSMQVVQCEFQELEYYSKFNSVQVIKEDFNSLFNVVQHVLNHSTSVAEKCLLGKTETIITETNSVPSVNCSLNMLKQIYCTVACKADSKLSDVLASIVGILPTHSGVERAVLTQAAFALSYGELLYYIDRQQLNSFALLISSLRRVDELIKVQQEDQFKMAIIDLNGLTKLTLELIGCILELDNLSKKDFIDDLSVVTEITGHVDTYSSYVIQVVVACMKQVNYLTYDRINITTKGLSTLTSELKEKLTSLKITFDNYKLIIGEWEAYRKLHSCFCNRSGIIEAFTCLMYPQPNPDLQDCHTGEPVRVDQVLKGKNVLLFISEADISEDDFLTLKTIHASLEIKHQDYKIVWIPVVEKWTPKATQDFNKWKNKMPWYVACYDKQTVGIKYIKKKWQFSYKSMVAVLNSQGAIECLDAMQMIRAWETHAFPFRPDGPDHCMGPIISTFTQQQIEEEKYIFLYGGKEEWINDFGTKVNELTTHVSSKVSINSFSIGVESSKMEKGQFWTRMESLLYVRMKRAPVGDDATKQIQKLLAFQNDDGWALLCKGKTIVTCASGIEIKEVVTNYEKWTMFLETKKFEICLQEYLNLVLKQQQTDSRPCRHVAIQSVTGWLPADVECPDCGERMERVVTYKCCHNNNAKENGSL